MRKKCPTCGRRQSTGLPCIPCRIAELTRQKAQNGMPGSPFTPAAPTTVERRTCDTKRCKNAAVDNEDYCSRCLQDRFNQAGDDLRMLLAELDSAAPDQTGKARHK